MQRVKHAVQAGDVVCPQMRMSSSGPHLHVILGIPIRVQQVSTAVGAGREACTATQAPAAIALGKQVHLAPGKANTMSGSNKTAGTCSTARFSKVPAHGRSGIHHLVCWQ